MIITEKIGNLETFDTAGRAVDRVPVKWFETSKRILHLRAQSGREVVLKFLSASSQLFHDDVLHADPQSLIVVDIQPCDVIVVQPATMQELVQLCYEIGNKHLPLYYDDGKVVTPFDLPLFNLLQASGYLVTKANHRLKQQVKTSVAPHNYDGVGSKSLFNRILKLTQASDGI